ncbi:MAG TPA: hypothetical protein VKP60_13470 [Magnetospirillaceae bacterium]|nr:hypothetical protein [Magnetospirillaceae bacterium]
MASSSPSLVLASLPGAAHGNRVVVLRGSHAESIAEQNGFDTLPVRSVAQAPGLLESGQAAFWLEGAAEVAMVELITGLSFAREAPPAPREEQLRQAWGAARNGTQLKALYRAAGIAILSDS